MDGMETVLKKHSFAGFLGKVKRRNTRTRVQGFVGDIAVGSSIICGDVADISCSGIKMTSLPENFSAVKHIYTTIVSGDGKHYKLLVKPCWKKRNTDGGVEIGFKILDAPLDWVDLTLNMSSGVDDSREEFGFHA